MSSSDTSPKERQKASILPQYVEFTPEIEAALDDEWARIAEELGGAPFETDDEDDEDGTSQLQPGETMPPGPTTAGQ